MAERQIYERALAELSRCETRVEELRAFLRLYEELAGLPAQPTSEGSPVDVVSQRKTSERARGLMQDWEQMADTAIRREARPLRPREIYEAIVPMGFQIDSKNPVNALATKLSRSPYFSKAGRGLFTTVEGAAEAVYGAAGDNVEDEDVLEHNERALSIAAPSDLWAAKGA